MKIALAQIDMKWEDKIFNRDKCSIYISSAKKENCSIIIFPEMTLTGFSMNTKLISEDEENSESIIFFKNQAIKNKITIVFGMVTAKLSCYYNSCIVINEFGQIISSYNKIHPFTPAKESLHITNGNTLSYFTSNSITFSTFICYDLRFPEPFFTASTSANVIIIIASWPKTRIKQWLILLQARAIETQSFIVAVNRVGTGDNLVYDGHSIIVNPYGDIISNISNEEKLIIGDLDMKESYDFRSAFQYKKDKKNFLYRIL